MKMVKSLLLGTAAGLVAMTGAQAADLPVKAKPVQYVKICSLYGAGFYYIPGTDMCLKVGGWVRFEIGDNHNGNLTAGPFSGNVNNRNTSNMSWRSRGYITADARNQSEYGTIRSYIAVGINTNSTGQDNAANQFSSNRAFIQLAGFTFGLSQSFFDFYSVPATAYWGSYPASDTGDPGWQVASYTAQLGNGLSASIGVEQRRMTQLINQATATTAAGSTGGTIGGSNGFSTAGSTVSGVGAYGGWQVPDVVANLRIDQAWGSAQVMAAAHEVNPGYYGATVENSGHAGDKWGWALGAGLKLNAPMIGAGDYLQTQVNYTVGAARYAIFTPQFNYYYQRGQSGAYGVLSDGVFGGTNANGATTGSAVELTTVWGVNAAYEHFWNKQWKTSLYGGYVATNYNSNANAMLCQAEGQGAGAGTLAVAVAGCNNNWSNWWLGSRTQWNVTADTYLGVDVLYQSLSSAGSATGLIPTAVVPAATATTQIGTKTEGNMSFRFRIHKDFYP